MMLHRLLSVALGLRTLVETSFRLLFGFRCLLTIIYHANFRARRYQDHVMNSLFICASWLSQHDTYRSQFTYIMNRS